LGLVAEPDGQHGQQRPSERKAQQHPAGEDVLFCRNERDGDQNRGSNQPSGHRGSDDQPDPTLGHRLDASGFLEIAVVDCRIHDGLTMRD
jgi:hypothetical protein